MIRRGNSQNIRGSIARFKKQPVLRRIVEHCIELGVQARRLAENSPERREIERRMRVLDGYTVPHFYERNGSELDDLVFRFRRILRDSGVSDEKINREDRRYRRRLTARPRGAPVREKRLFREAYEQRLATPRRTWRQIAESVGLERYSLERGVRRLKELLRTEGIRIPNSPRAR